MIQLKKNPNLKQLNILLVDDTLSNIDALKSIIKLLKVQNTEILIETRHNGKTGL